MPEMTVTVTRAALARHTYALCGHIVVRSAKGVLRRLEVNATGVLSDAADREFEAMASDGFTRFYLVDVTPDRAPATVEASQSSGCAAAVS